jgi:hypothetical protein
MVLISEEKIKKHTKYLFFTKNAAKFIFFLTDYRNNYDRLLLD